MYEIKGLYTALERADEDSDFNMIVEDQSRLFFAYFDSRDEDKPYLNFDELELERSDRTLLSDLAMYRIRTMMFPIDENTPANVKILKDNGWNQVSDLSFKGKQYKLAKKRG